jgi:hypothetical protein
MSLLLHGIKTSYFAKYKKPDGVSIAWHSPFWYKGPVYPALAPTESILMEYKTSKQDEAARQRYIKRYRDEVLSRLDPEKVARDLDGKVMLCYEKPNDFCHRHLVVAWLEVKLGLKILNGHITEVE